MYLKWTSEFIRFLNYKDHTIEEMLSHLVLCTLAPLHATSGFISTLDNQNSVTTAGRFGIPLEVSESYGATFSLSDKVPITEALRLRKTILIDTLPNWPSEYPLLIDSPYRTGEVCFIALPIEKSDTPVAVLGVFSSKQIKQDANVNLFLESISYLLSMFLFPSIELEQVDHKFLKGSETISIPGTMEKLSDRQLLILRLISLGHTNVSIAEMLKYSESTVRQETIKIFTKLRCTGRKEAARIYLDDSLNANIA
jgi:DNA-binding CsgD family transcriptional regulator